MTAILRYFGGKVLMAPKIISLFPSHDAYVEPYAGGAAVLLAKPRSKLEVYNDINGDMANLFRVLRDRREDLAEAVALTPFSREEHEIAYQPSDDPLERARRVLIRSHFGFGSNGIHKPTGFRAAGLRAGSLPVHGWMKMPEAIRVTAERMRGVVVENRPAVQVMQSHDSPSALFYVDPPYLHETRDRTSRYANEMTEADHIEMLACLKSLKGSVVLSGYASDLYDRALEGWRRIELRALADQARERIEVLWCNFTDHLPLEGMR